MNRNRIEGYTFRNLCEKRETEQSGSLFSCLNEMDRDIQHMIICEVKDKIHAMALHVELVRQVEIFVERSTNRRYTYLARTYIYINIERVLANIK